MKRQICLLVTAFMLGCNDPHNVVVPKDIQSWEKNEELKAAIQKLPDPEKQAFIAYTARMAIGQVFGGNSIPEGTTVGAAIEEQKKWQIEKELEEAKQKALAEKMERERQEAMKVMNGAVTASLLSFSLQPKDYDSQIYSDYFQMKIGIQNNTDKELIGVKGVVVLRDVFGEVIKRIGLSYDENIKGNGVTKYVGTLDYNQFRDEDRKLASTSFEKLKFEWEPNIYLYKDGTKLSTPE